MGDPKAILVQAQAAMVAFRATFGVDLSVNALVEAMTANALGLTITGETNTPGYDAIAPDGARYQIKYRADTTPNVDFNNFNFDFLVLVNLTSDFKLTGMWQITALEAQQIAVYRERFRKYQTTQTKIKAIGTQLYS